MEWNKNFQTNSIFVYNFPNEWMENDIKKNFMIFGTINNIIIDKDINIYAFIQYNDTEASQKAIEVMNGKEINGKLLKVTSRKIVDECIDMNTNKLDSQQKSQKFKTFGNLESATVAKKNDKTSKGYGFVVYTDPHSAALAISNMNKVEVYTGKRLKVLLKSSSNETNKRKIKPGCTIFVFYLPNDWSDKDLKRHFSHYGNILGATIKRETNGKSRGYGFINFENQQSAINAVAGMNGFNAGNKYLKVSIKKGEEQYLAPQYLNIDRMNNSYNSPPPPPPPMSCHGNESSNYANNEMYSIQNTMPNNRYNSRVSTNDVHQSFINTQYGHFPYNFFKNNEQGPYMQRSYNKTYNNMGKT
ncbi:polyadenylate binding protein [Plasmodium falciparum IGH-CR14]|uniref:Polyadenylate binding protein n=1 Tax=Plasmodium falciparum IGH-CR14 TaxID=580059 RepID=A0A0L1I7N9_PLAFA|nr:polyadenylate binding protein [Plasmodium falciparum IGH-CR14]